jgi:hypothetical protein
VLPRLLHVLFTWYIADKPGDVYGVEGVEIASYGCARPAAESGASALGGRELMKMDVEVRRWGMRRGDFGFGFAGLAEGVVLDVHY